MSIVMRLATRAVELVYPRLPRGPHHLAREKLRRAYLLGFEAGYRKGSRL